MNESQIETLLRRAPRPPVPAGLKRELQADIRLLRSASARPTGAGKFIPSWRRWLPAFSVGLLFLACLVVLAVQTSQVLQRRRENQSLKASSNRMEELLQQRQTLQARAVQAQELDQLRKGQAEMEQLRAEVARLRELTSTLATLQAENQRLKVDLAARQAQAAASAPAEEDPFAEARKRAQRIACANNLRPQ